jgi:hypothetical protein
MRTYGVYYNFNELLELEDELHFYDEDHLNQSGVEIFSAKLIEILFENEENMDLDFFITSSTHNADDSGSFHAKSRYR